MNDKTQTQLTQILNLVNELRAVLRDENSTTPQKRDAKTALCIIRYKIEN